MRFDDGTKYSYKDYKRINLALAKKFYQYHELMNDPIISDYGSWSQQLGDRISDCSTNMRVYKNTEKTDFRLSRHRCKNKFCPICNRVESGKTADFLQKDYNNSDKDLSIYWTVVFTMPNVILDDFGDAIRDMSKAFSLWNNHYRRTLNYIAGLRTFEFTWNKKDDTFHPHIHLLLKWKFDNICDRELMLDKLKHFNFGKSFAQYLPLNRVGLCWHDNSKLEQDTVSLDSYNKSIYLKNGYSPYTIYHSEIYKPDKCTLFEFSKYITKLNKILTLDPISFVNIYRSLNYFKIRHFLGQWRSWEKQLDIEDGKVWCDSNSIIHNAKWVYYGRYNIMSETLIFCGKKIIDNDFNNWLIEHNAITKFE